MIKKLLLFSILIPLFSSCQYPTNEKGEEIRQASIDAIYYDNHKYLMFWVGGEPRGVVHDPNCKCHGNN